MNPKEIKLRCLVIIAERGTGDEISALVKDYAHFQSIILGKGTANSEIEAALAISNPEKDIIYCFIEKHNVDYVYFLLEEQFELKKKHKGIAFTIPLSSIDGLTSLKILTGMNG